MATKTAFISFDFDNDEFLRTALVGQAKNDDTPFNIVDRSLREPLSGDWREKIKGRIQRSDLVIVMCGENTHLATGVATELKIAQEIKKPYFLLQGYADKTCTKPTTALSTDKMYNWTWSNLKALIDGGR
ncbi:MAG: hypothetical protein A2583_16010 [Bdellovibrionales bacterium RIFOXYD1_FULL_53_11]|nr:MAG: hypothetical protein A2583_16010 [Bdellovibrionales bacterium RIFOXYD1_FULL_53_11]